MSDAIPRIHKSPGSIAAEEQDFDQLANDYVREYGEGEKPRREGYARGWYFPVSITRLVIEDHVLTGEDLVLLGIINMMQDPKKQGCWASSEWIARRWGRTARHVQRRLPVLLELGLIRSFQLKDGQRLRRILQVTWAGDNYQGSSTTALPRSFPSKRNGRKQPRNRELRENTGGVAAAGCDLVFENGEFPPTNAGKLCLHFERFIKRHKLNKAIDRHTGEEVEVKINRHNWLRACATLLNGSHPSSIKEIMDWYFEHHLDKYVPKCGSFMTFAENYQRIKAARCREQGEDLGQEAENERMAAESERQRHINY